MVDFLYIERRKTGSSVRSIFGSVRCVDEAVVGLRLVFSGLDWTGFFFCGNQIPVLRIRTSFFRLGLVFAGLDWTGFFFCGTSKPVLRTGTGFFRLGLVSAGLDWTGSFFRGAVT